MKRFLLLSTLGFLGLSFLSGCKNTNNDTNEEHKDEEIENKDPILPPIPEEISNLSSTLDELVKASDVTVKLTGSGKTTVHYPGGDRMDNSGTINRTIMFSDDIYYYEDAFPGELNSTDYIVDYIAGGYVNKNNKVNAYSLVGDEFKSEGVVSSKYSKYQEAIYTFKDLNLTNFQDFEENEYNLDLTAVPLFPDIASNPIDFSNFEVLSGIFKFGKREETIDAMKFVYNEKTRNLEVHFSTNYKEGQIVFKGEYKAIIQPNYSDLKSIRSYAELSEFETPKENLGFNQAQDLLETGYTIDDYSVSMSDGTTLPGKIYVTKDYYALDYTQDGAELLDGFFVRDGALYSVGITSSGTLATQKVLSTDDIKVLNDENGSNFTASDFCNLFGATKTGTLPVYASFAGRKGSPYVTELPGLKENLKVYEVNDFGGVLGIPGQLEELIPVTLMYPGFIPLGYTMIHDTEKNIITFGWQAYGDLNGKFGVYGANNMLTVKNFGTKHKTMEHLILSRGN